ncbi:hypothetical protein SS37A_37150 (plasmid) [Methylocystis iwaonis]|uniref:Uncharacterized protein n=1 Tax=Methylocystis iwaonis TaxID=2885079 RepID=A0ABN6VP95_9HYPH|nr:hypothetical protein SS37A_37150 [Methylocystis iwaonis]
MEKKRNIAPSELPVLWRQHAVLIDERDPLLWYSSLFQPTMKVVKATFYKRIALGTGIENKRTATRSCCGNNMFRNKIQDMKIRINEARIWH